MRQRIENYLSVAVEGMDMSEIKNCLECPKDKTCSSWYGGSMCTEAPGREADDDESK